MDERKIKRWNNIVYVIPILNSLQLVGVKKEINKKGFWSNC